LILRPHSDAVTHASGADTARQHSPASQGRKRARETLAAACGQKLSRDLKRLGLLRKDGALEVHPNISTKPGERQRKGSHLGIHQR